MVYTSIYHPKYFPDEGSETPPDLVKTGELLEAVDISKDLAKDQAKALHEVLLTNHLAFGLDGRLGSICSFSTPKLQCFSTSFSSCAPATFVTQAVRNFHFFER